MKTGNIKNFLIAFSIMTLVILVTVLGLRQMNNSLSRDNVEETPEITDDVVNNNDINSQGTSGLSEEKVVLFTEEEMKTIEFGELYIELSDYYVGMCTENKDNFLYKLLKSNDVNTVTPKEITIEVKEVYNKKFASEKEMINYVRELYSGYDKLSIYYNIDDKNGLVDYYKVEMDGKAKYGVFYTEKAYEIESSSAFIRTEIFSSFYIPCYEEINEEILENDIPIAHIESKYTYFEDKAEMKITQTKSNDEFTVKIYAIETSYYTLEVKDSNGDILFTAQIPRYSYPAFYYSFVKVLDLNGDGHGDLQILRDSSPRNDIYDIYVYNEDTNSFIKIDIGDEMLSNIEVREGYIYNWISGYDEGTAQYFVIEGDKLVKVDEVHMVAE